MAEPIDFNDPENFRQAVVAVLSKLDMRYVRCVRGGAPAKHPYVESDITRHVAALQLTRPDGEVVTCVIGVAEEPWKDAGVWCEPDHRALKYDFRLFEETMARVNQAWAGLMDFAERGWVEKGVGSAMPMLGDEPDQPKES